MDVILACGCKVRAGRTLKSPQNREQGKTRQAAGTRQAALHRPEELRSGRVVHRARQGGGRTPNREMRQGLFTKGLRWLTNFHQRPDKFYCNSIGWIICTFFVQSEPKHVNPWSARTATLGFPPSYPGFRGYRRRKWVSFGRSSGSISCVRADFAARAAIKAATV